MRKVKSIEGDDVFSALSTKRREVHIEKRHLVIRPNFLRSTQAINVRCYTEAFHGGLADQ